MPKLVSGKIPSQAYSALGFDFGSQKIGIASGQSLTATASPLSIIKAKNGIPNWDELGQLLTQWQPALIVVGLPLNMDGSESELSKRASKFARRLAAKSDCAVALMDERLSSREARDIGGKDKDIDDIAAVLILESWFRANS